MIQKLLGLACLGVAAFIGFKMGSGSETAHAVFKEYPLTEKKSFVFIVYAHTQAPWCARSLRSIFEQEYDHYRVIFIDDASSDNTFETAKDYIVETNQSHRAIMVRNEKVLGFAASVNLAMEHLLEKEIAIPIDAKDWLAHCDALQRLNRAYQNPDVWMAAAGALTYPAYQNGDRKLETFYAGLLKKGGEIRSAREVSKGHIQTLAAPLLFVNETGSSRQR